MKNQQLDKNTKGILSVVIPAYNVENYIDRCIESLERQGDVVKELIIVNDGSTDSTLKHIVDLKKRYGNIVVFTQKNQGLFWARINGVRHVKTKWLTFCDSDDFIDAFFYERVLMQLENTQNDILEFGYRKIQGSTILYEFAPNFQIMDSNEGIRRIIEKDDSSCSNWNKIYRTSLFENLFSCETIRCYEEDKYINVRVMEKATSVMKIPMVGYNYDTRIDSITARKLTPQYFRILDTNKYLYKHIKKNRKDLLKIVAYDYCAHLAYCYIIAGKIETSKESLIIRRTQIKKEYFKVFKETDLKGFKPKRESIKRKIMLKLFTVNPWFATIVGYFIK